MIPRSGDISVRAGYRKTGVPPANAPPWRASLVPTFHIPGVPRFHGQAGNDLSKEQCFRPIAQSRIGRLAGSRIIGLVKDACLECKNCGRGAPNLPERHAVRSQKPLPGRKIEAFDSPGTVLLCNDTNISPIHILWANQNSVCCGLFSRCNSPHDFHLRNKYIL